MDYMLFGFMALLLLYTVYRNVTLLKRYKQNKEYIECYKAILRGDENAYERISNFIDSLSVSDSVKEELRAISPSSYTGL